MPFRLRHDTRDWFKQISNEFDIRFDMYYLCLMAGLAYRRKEDIPTAETTELVNEFPQDGNYNTRKHTIIGLFLSRELQEMGIKMEDRSAMHDLVHRLVDPSAPNHLSDEGMKQMNRYAYGGFDAIRDYFQSQPQSLDAFLKRYKILIDLSQAS